MENAHPFIQLGDDGENAPRLSYSIPESTDYVGTNVVTVDIDSGLLNEATRTLLQENLEEKNDAKPATPLRDPRIGNLKLTTRNPPHGDSGAEKRRRASVCQCANLVHVPTA